MKMLLRETALVLLNVAVLLGSVAWAVFRLRPDSAVSSPAAATSAPKGMLIVSAVRIDEIEAQPLFHRSRQPPKLAEPLIAAATPLPALPSSLPILLGVAGSAGHLGALLDDGSGSKTQLVRAGQTFDGWTVVEVRSRQVQLRNGKNTAKLVLRPGLTSPQAGAASSAVQFQ